MGPTPEYKGLDICLFFCYVKKTLWLNEGEQQFCSEGGAHKEMQCPHRNTG